MDHIVENDTFQMILSKDSIDKSSTDVEITTGDITVEFNKSIELSRNMECAIVDISVPTKLMTITEDIVILLNFGKFRKHDLYGITEFQYVKTIKKYNIKTGFYTDQELFDAIIKETRTVEDDYYENYDKFSELADIRLLPILPKFEYKDGFISMTIGTLTNDYYMFFNFNERSEQIFGFSKNQFHISYSPFYHIPEKNDTYYHIPEKNDNSTEIIVRAKFKMNIQEKNKCLFVYCDIVKPSYVGNLRTNILRVLPLGNVDGSETQLIKFQNLLYIPLKKHTFNSIQMIIANNLGEIVKFKKGNIFITLLFRPLEHN